MDGGEARGPVGIPSRCAAGSGGEPVGAVLDQFADA
jgi:hypothetical protein